MRSIRLLIVAVVAALSGGTTHAGPLSSSDQLEGEIRRSLAERCDTRTDAVIVPELSGFDGLFAEGERSIRLLPSEGCLGNVPVTAVWDQKSAGERRAVVTAQIRQRRWAVFATRTIEAGEIVSGDLLRREELWVEREDHRRLEDPHAVLGMRTRRRIPRGAAVERAWLELVPLVERGDRVRILFTQGALRIEASGRAQHDAGLGEAVRALNLDSKREIVGRVGPGGVVLVDF